MICVMKYFFIFLVAFTSKFLWAAQNELTVFGELHSKPCSIKPGDELMDLKLETVTDAQLFSGIQRTSILLFDIHLEKCNPNVAKKLKVKIDGTPSPYNPEFIELASSSVAKGLGIGFTDRLGNYIALGGSLPFSIKEGDMIAQLGVYMKALSKNDFKVGPYKATANLTLSYE